eukprot:Lankesteria_metandrocarpae@DN4078_c0_g1_i1.p1
MTHTGLALTPAGYNSDTSTETSRSEKTVTDSSPLPKAVQDFHCEDAKNQVLAHTPHLFGLGVSPVLPGTPEYRLAMKLLTSKRVDGGITNALVLVEFTGTQGGPKSGTETSCDSTECTEFVNEDVHSVTTRKLIVRYYGMIETVSALHKTTAFLRKHGIDKQVYYYDSSLQIEEWLEGRSLEVEELANVSVWRLVAQQIAAVHSLPAQEAPRRPNTVDTSDEAAKVSPDSELKSEIWSFAYHFLVRAERHLRQSKVADTPMWVTRLKSFVNTSRILQKFFYLKAAIKRLRSDIVLSHNDVLNGNILINTTTGDIRLIDFEYCCLAERGYDIANHFCEWAGFECEWNLFPDNATRWKFAVEYLTALKQFNNDNNSYNHKNSGAVYKAYSCASNGPIGSDYNSSSANCNNNDNTNNKGNVLFSNYISLHTNDVRHDKAPSETSLSPHPAPRQHMQARQLSYNSNCISDHCASAYLISSDKILTSNSQYNFHTCQKKIRDNLVEQFLEEVKLCCSLSHLMWGLWAVVQSFESTVNFDYVGYAERRLRAFDLFFEKFPRD